MALTQTYKYTSFGGMGSYRLGPFSKEDCVHAESDWEGFLRSEWDHLHICCLDPIFSNTHDQSRLATVMKAIAIEKRDKFMVEWLEHGTYKKYND